MKFEWQPPDYLLNELFMWKAHLEPDTSNPVSVPGESCMLKMWLTLGQSANQNPQPPLTVRSSRGPQLLLVGVGVLWCHKKTNFLMSGENECHLFVWHYTSGFPRFHFPASHHGQSPAVSWAGLGLKLLPWVSVQGWGAGPVQHQASPWGHCMGGLQGPLIFILIIFLVNQLIISLLKLWKHYFYCSFHFIFLISNCPPYILFHLHTHTPTRTRTHTAVCPFCVWVCLYFVSSANTLNHSTISLHICRCCVHPT